MKRRRATAWAAWATCAAVAAAAPGGCTVGLADGAGRSGGYAGARYVARAQAGSRDDVPVRGHDIRVVRTGGDSISGELIAASGDDMVIERASGQRVRIPFTDVKSVGIQLAPNQAGTTALISVAAIAVGLAGLASVDEHSSARSFLGGWGIVWVPLGILVALPTAAVIAGSGDATFESGPSLGPMLRNLFQFARYPQGEPGRVSKRTVPNGPYGPSPAPPKPTPPDESDDESDEQPNDTTRPAVVPYAPDRSPPPPPR